MANNPRPKLKTKLRPRTSPDTKFYVDYDWWEESNLDLKTYLYNRLAIGDEASLELGRDEIDVVDSRTGQVRRVDGFQYVVQTYFSQLPEDFMSRASLVDAVFCVLLAHANEPMTAQELADQVQRPIEVVLRTLAGPRVYQGIRPVYEEE